MDSRQIDVVLKSDSIVTANNFLGVFPSDKIPSTSTEIYPCCAVVNTKPHDHPGEHWVCFLKTKTNQGIYFDSYGVPPYNLPEIAEVLDGCDSWTLMTSLFKHHFQLSVDNTLFLPSPTCAEGFR